MELFKKLMLWHKGEIHWLVYLCVCGKFEWTLGAWSAIPIDETFKN